MEGKKSVFEMIEEEELQELQDPQNFTSQIDPQEEQPIQEVQNPQLEPQVVVPPMEVDPVQEHLDRRQEMLEIEAMLHLPYFDFQYQQYVGLKYHWLSAELQTESIASMKYILSNHLKMFYPDLQQRVKNLKKANYFNLIAVFPEQQRLNSCLACLLSNRTLQLKMAEINRIMLENNEFQLAAVAPILQALYELLQPHQESLVQQFIHTTVAEVNDPMKPIEQDTISMYLVLREQFTAKKTPKNITSIFEFLIKAIQNEFDFLIPDMNVANLFKFQTTDKINAQNSLRNSFHTTATNSHYFLELNCYNHQNNQLQLQQLITTMFQQYKLNASQGTYQRSLSKPPEVMVIFINRAHYNGITFVTEKFTLGFPTHLKFSDENGATVQYQIQSMAIGEFNEQGDQISVENYNTLLFHDDDFFKQTSDGLIFCERGMNPIEVDYEAKLGQYPWVLIYGKY